MPETSNPSPEEVLFEALMTDFVGTLRLLSEDQRKDVTQAIGEIVLLWNELHSELGHIFVRAARMSDFDVAWCIWGSQNSDLAQRKMLRATLGAAKGFPEKLVEEAIDVINKADALSNKRNEAIHAPITLHIGNQGELRYEPHITTELSSGFANKLAGKNILSEFKNHAKRVDQLLARTRKIHKRFPAHHPD